MAKSKQEADLKIHQKVENSDEPLFQAETYPDLTNVSLEEALKQLDTIMDQMEQGDTSLEESFLLYQRGMSLVKHCSNSIDRVEKQLRILEENGVSEEACLK